MRRRLAGALVAVVAVIGASLIGVGGFAGRVGVDHVPLVSLPSLAVSPADAATLDRLARNTRAAAGNTVPLAPGQYLYDKELFSHPSDGPYSGLYRLRSVIQNWWAFDGRNRVLTHYLPVLPLRASDRPIVEAHREQLNRRMVRIPVTNDFYPPAEGRGYERYFGRGLPSTPTGLFDARQTRFNAEMRASHPASVRAYRRQNYASEMFDGLSGTLRGSLSPKQRAAAYTDLKYIPGIQVLGRARDSIGRLGTAIQLKIRETSPYAPSSLHTVQWVVDPHTGQLLQSATWDNRSCCGGVPGSARTVDVYLKSAIVDSMTALPDGGAAAVRPGTIVR